jgi:hypothetical protein
MSWVWLVFGDETPALRQHSGFKNYTRERAANTAKNLFSKKLAGLGTVLRVSF